MSGKLLSLFDHPEFVRRADERAQRELLQRIWPSERVSPSRLRCRRCSLEYDVMPRLPTADRALDEPCPRCEPPSDLDALSSFLARLVPED